MRGEQQSREVAERWQRLGSWATPLAICGVLLPYAVATLPTVLFRPEIQSREFYHSGKLATFDTLTSYLTAGAIVLGAGLCWPWVRDRSAATESPILLMFALLGLAVFHLISVFIVRFLFYTSSGGIL